MRAALLATLVGGILYGVPTRCSAQADLLRNEKANINRILRGGALAGADEKLFDQYFCQFFMQFLNPNACPESFHDVRKDLQIFLRMGKSGPSYNALIKKATTGLRQVAGSASFSPAARVNAVLTLGSLNESEPGGKPLASELPVLKFIVESKDLVRFPDSTKIAALVGLERYAREGAIPPAQQADLFKMLLAILEQQTPPDNRTAEGHTWMRRSAAQVLAALGNPGPNNSLIAAMEKIIADPGARASLRCEMAECLGKLQYPKDAKIDYPALANLLGHQTVEICQGELEAAKNSGRNPSRGMIVYALASTLHGLEGPTGRTGLLAAAAGTPTQAAIAELRKKIKETSELMQDEDEVADTQLATKVNELVTEMQAVLPPKPQPKQDVVAAADGAAAAPPKPAVPN
ncbi:MAG: hypothetical protein WD845_14005 [Pirellulales bacterium]